MALEWTTSARVAAIAAVVMLHSAAGAVIGNDVGTPDWWAGNIYDAACRWCVPVFVIISGALLLHEGRQETATAFYRKRLHRILVPLLFWSLVFVLWNALRQSVAGHQVDARQLALSVMQGLPHYHMWFLYMILGLYLVTPLFRIVMRNCSTGKLVQLVAVVFVLVTIYAVWHPKQVPQTPFLFWFLPYTSYYLLGGLLTRIDPKGSSGYWGMLFGLSVIATAGVCYVLARRYGPETALYIYGYFSVTVIAMSFACIVSFKRYGSHPRVRALANRLAPLTLGIYVIHPLVLEPLRLFVVPGNFPMQWVVIPLLAAAVYGTALGASWVISKTPYLRAVI